MKNGKASKEDAERKIEGMKEEIAKLRSKGQDGKERLENAIESLQRSVKELDYARKNPAAATQKEKDSMLADAELAAQDAARAINQLPQAQGQQGKDAQKGQSKGQQGQEGKGSEPGRSSGSLGQRANQALSDTRNFVNIAHGNHDLSPQILDGLKEMLSLAQAALEAARSKEPVRNFNPDDVPKDYRDDVSNYFKRLSEGSGQTQ